MNDPDALLEILKSELRRLRHELKYLPCHLEPLDCAKVKGKIESIEWIIGMIE